MRVLRLEERWVPVAQSGDRWAGRTYEAAQQALARYPAGGAYSDGSDWDGVTHIERETRLVSDWSVAE